MEVRIEDNLWEDFYQAYHYYEDTCKQGERFEDDFYNALIKIQEIPYGYQMIDESEHLRCSLNHYKYSVFYWIDETDEIIWILALAGQKRRPFYWRK